ncbi:MAG: PspA/IM30 family protein [Leptolyngbyaceae cyanobacterium T60_A2020_046]|nr:PspA/IM30 family protein [Leptolyngbyaceae cyanobacterium T60_A2020_046]
MGLFGQLGQAIRAQINDWVRGVEDPEQLLDQALVEMHADLVQLRQAVAQAIATQKRTERQHEQNQALAQEWYNRAQLALQGGNEAQARDALARRQTYQQTTQQLEKHLVQQRDIIAQLKENMRTLERQIVEARTRRDMYIARARSAEASQRIQVLMDQVGPRQDFGVLGRMEERVLELEAQAAAIAELSADRQANTIEARFAALESGESTIEADLKALKETLHQPPPAS